MSAGRDRDFETAGFDVAGFEVVVFEAWRRFEANLTTYLAALPEGSYITITSAQASHGTRGQRPYVDLVGVDDLIVGVASLPSYLYPGTPGAESGDRRLYGLGWSEPGKPMVDGTIMDYTIDGQRDEADLIATVAVATFREVWNVPHPSFLSAWAVGLSGEADGPVALAHNPGVADEAADVATAGSLPTELRSLHAFCEVAGARVDSATVHAVCASADLSELHLRARAHARGCVVQSEQCTRDGAKAAARVWSLQARSWCHTADSVRMAIASRNAASSGHDRPA
ncbi:MAG: hypothetical protein WBQ44_15305 [Rhodococcus sp. (in: high G+C Gram-positive bacteria)]